MDDINTVTVVNTTCLSEEQRLSYLAVMGITVWLSRNSATTATEQTVCETSTVAANEIVPVQVQTVTQCAPQDIPPSPPSALPPEPPAVVPPVITTVPQLLSITQAWDVLEQDVAQCQLCAELVANRSRTVFGVGNRHTNLLVIGEAPGADEDLQGEPFVGRAGQLLNAMLNAIGLKRETVYIANILKCRPPNNRDPQPEEALHCQQFLLRQITLLAPKLMLAVGRIAAQNLLKTQIAIGKLRGRVHEYGEKRIPLVVTYHPAYLLRAPGQKAEAWKDLQIVARILRAG